MLLLDVRLLTVIVTHATDLLLAGQHAVDQLEMVVINYDMSGRMIPLIPFKIGKVLTDLRKQSLR